MKLGDIAFNIYTYTLLCVAGLGVAYLVVAAIYTAQVEDRQHNFRGAVKVGSIEVVYNGRMPYNPTLPLPSQDRDGYAKVGLNGNRHALLKYEDLTASPLEYRIIVIDSEGKELEFDDKAKYDEKTREDILKLKSISDIVEREIREANARR